MHALGFLVSFAAAWACLDRFAASPPTPALALLALLAVVALLSVAQRAVFATPWRQVPATLGLSRCRPRILLVATVTGAAVVFGYLIGAALVDVHLHLRSGWALVLFGALVYHGLAEEVVWRGFVLARLRDRFSLHGAVIRSVPLMALTHTPILLSDGLVVGLLAVFVAAVTCIPLAWLWEHGGRSVWPSALVHGLIGSWQVFRRDYPASFSVVVMVVSLVVPLLVVASFRRRPRPRTVRPVVAVPLALAAALLAPALVVPAPQAYAASRTSDDLTRIVQPLRVAGATGAVVRLDDGWTVGVAAIGAADLATGRRLGRHDQVRIGSITKPMVATVLLQLAGEGRLRLDDPVASTLPGLVPDDARITVRMLLNHTSGLFDYTQDAAFRQSVLTDPFRPWTPQELLAVAAAHPSSFPPGTRWAYSNTDYVAAGLIAERVTGTDLGSLLWQRVFGPLHLDRTFFATTGTFTRRYAHGYLPAGLAAPAPVDVSDWAPTWAWAAGAVVSDADDTASFLTALLSGRLLDRRMQAELLTAVPAEGPTGYGLGIRQVPTACGEVWGHDGSIFGYRSFALADRTGTRSLVLLVPTEPDAALGAATGQAVDQLVCRMLRRGR